MFRKLITKFKVWKLGRQKAESRVLPDGSVIIKSNNLYFLAVDRGGVPVLISEVEGARLWDSKG